MRVRKSAAAYPPFTCGAVEQKMCPFLVWLVKTKCGGLIKRSKTLLMIVEATGSVKQQTLRHSAFF